MKIGIIGGGLAGLYLAYKLSKDRNNEVHLYEKSGYFGGRIYTNNLKGIKSGGEGYYLKEDMSDSDRKLIDSVVYECGAARFTKNQKKLIDLMNELGIRENNFIPIDVDFEYRSERDDLNTDGNRYTKLINKIVSRGKGIKNLENLSLHNLLSRTLNIDELTDFRNMSAYASEFLKMNARDALNRFNMEFIENPQFYVLNGGLSMVINKMVDICNSRKNCSLKNLTSIIDIMSEDNKFYLNLNRSVSFDKVYVTIAPGQLGVLSIFDQLEPVISKIGVHRLMRLYVVFSKNSSGKVWFNGKKKCRTDNILQFLLPVSESQGLMMIYVEDEYCDLWLENEKNGTIVDDIMRELGKIYKGEDFGEILYARCHYWDNATHYFMSGVDSDKYSRGLRKPYSDIELYLSNEAYSKSQAWMEGSLEMVDF